MYRPCLALAYDRPCARATVANRSIDSRHNDGFAGLTASLVFVFMYGIGTGWWHLWVEGEKLGTALAVR